jgi:hypothetical protein
MAIAPTILLVQQQQQQQQQPEIKVKPATSRGVWRLQFYH